MHVLPSIVQACPVNISPMGIVLDMRRSSHGGQQIAESITSMFNNIENNGAPWAFPQPAVRLDPRILNHEHVSSSYVGGHDRPGQDP